MQKQPRPGEYNLAEVVMAANKRITKEKIRPTDPRAKATVTARTVQFYLSKGLLPEPTRRGAQLRFDNRHVEAIVEVKRRQADGLMLDEITRAPLSEAQNHAAVSSRPTESRSLLWQEPLNDQWLNARFTTATPSRLWSTQSLPLRARTGLKMRWHIGLGETFDDYELTGSGPPPSEEAIERIRKILQEDLRKVLDD